MLDPRVVREQTQKVRQALENRRARVDLDLFLATDAKWRDLSTRIQELRHEQNRFSKEFARQKREGNSPSDHLDQMKQIKTQLSALEAEHSDCEKQRTALLMEMPNIPMDTVPGGQGEKDNQLVRQWGKPPVLGFDPRPHWEIGEVLGILDFARAARMTGARFSVYAGPGARLCRALINFMIDLHSTQHGYTEVLAPFMVNRASLEGTGQLPKFEDDLFKLKDEDYFLIPTAEVSVTNLHREEILLEKQLPLSYVAYSPCFRREAGSYGKDVRGLIRQHQFDKVELVKFVHPQDSAHQWERMVLDAEAVLQRLGIHYRVMELCTGDLGFAATRTYDLEVWLPAEGVYREISSCSHFDAFQARRCGIRYRPSGGGKPEHVHTLNGSALAIGRTVAAILENFQQEDGSVEVPEVLRTYMGGLKKITQ